MAHLMELLFLSTLSLRRATQNSMEMRVIRTNFYPRSPCGERLRGWTLNINGPIFLSTLSLRRATANFCRNRFCPTYFYPRSPCGERRIRHIGKARSENFYPRSPCGERRKSNKLAGKKLVFLSTLSLRRATPIH